MKMVVNAAYAGVKEREMCMAASIAAYVKSARSVSRRVMRHQSVWCRRGAAARRRGSNAVSYKIEKAPALQRAFRLHGTLSGRSAKCLGSMARANIGIGAGARRIRHCAKGVKLGAPVQHHASPK